MKPTKTAELRALQSNFRATVLAEFDALFNQTKFEPTSNNFISLGKLQVSGFVVEDYDDPVTVTGIKRYLCENGTEFFVEGYTTGQLVGHIDDLSFDAFYTDDLITLFFFCEEIANKTKA